MKLRSFEELECLLPEEEREKRRLKKVCEEPIDNRPSFMRTKCRVLPLLPRWMKHKLIEAKELHNHCNTSWGDNLWWNHTITLPLDKKHDITFAILDCYKWSADYIVDEVKKIVEVYRDLQVLYREYGHSLTIVSMQTNDYGMYLPSSFYEERILPEEDTPEVEDSIILNEDNVEEIIAQLCMPKYTRMHYLEEWAEDYSNTLDDRERVSFNTSFAYQHKAMTDYCNKMEGILQHSVHDYYVQPMWDCIDLYMAKGRMWDREFCIKWNIGENLSHLKKLDTLRPFIDDIIVKTHIAEFAFGVKKRHTNVICCDAPNAQQ